MQHIIYREVELHRSDRLQGLAQCYPGGNTIAYLTDPPNEGPIFNDFEVGILGEFMPRLVTKKSLFGMIEFDGFQRQNIEKLLNGEEIYPKFTIPAILSIEENSAEPFAGRGLEMFVRAKPLNQTKLELKMDEEARIQYHALYNWITKANGFLNLDETMEQARHLAKKHRNQRHLAKSLTRNR